MTSTTYCAGCGVDVLPTAPRVTLSDIDEAIASGGTDWHPGCWAAEWTDTDGTRAEHLARARAALTRPPTRRQV